MRARVLVIDEDPQVLSVLATVLTDQGAYVVCEQDARRGMELLKSEPVDVLFTDLRYSDRRGTDVLREAQAIQPTMPVVVITAHGSVESTVRALRSGAVDYLTKPFRAELVAAALARAIAKLTQQHLQVSRATASDRVAQNFPTTIVAASPAMKQVAVRSKQIAPSTLPLLIVGELGVGKEQVARMIHSISPWREEPFVKVSCEAVQESQLVEMFFGDEATSKESANDEEGNSSRSGLIEQAAGGTLFLRNLVGLPRWMQEQLLQAAQAGRFFRKGGVKPIPFRARIAASTLCDPARSVKEGRLLDELHFYLGAHSLVIPPLRDRREDIRPLISALVQEASRDPSLSVRGPAPTFSEESLQLLEAHNWPGNVCELSNVVRRVFVFISEPEVTADHVAEMLPVLPGSDTITVPFGGNLKEIERAIVAEVIHRARGNKSAAARSLGLHRKTLYRIIEQGVGVPNQRAGG